MLYYISDLINRVFKPYLNKFVVTFIEDILIYSKDKEKHVKHFRIIIQIFRKHQLYAMLKRYKFWLNKVIFLGISLPNK